MRAKQQGEAVPAEYEGISCLDCAPPLWVQGGDEGWRQHRYYLHGEGAEPHQPEAWVRRGPAPSPAQYAEMRRRRIAARRTGPREGNK